MRAIISIAMAAAASCLCLSCALASASGEPGTVSIQASMPGLADLSGTRAISASLNSHNASKTFYPSALDLSSVSYTAVLTKTSPAHDSPQTISGNASGSFSFASATPGDWSVEVRAYAADGATVIGSGSASLTVSSAATASSSIALSPPAGSGDLSISVDWSSSGAAATPAASLSPLSYSGADIGLAIASPSASSATCSATGVSAGFYRLTLSLLSSGGESLWSTREIAYVFPNATTVGTVQIANLNSAPEAFSALSAAWAYDGSASAFDEIALSWYGAGGASSFAIERAQASTAAGLGSAAASVIAPAVAARAFGYVDPISDPSLYYRYTVTASNAYGSNASRSVDIAPIGAASASAGSALSDFAIAINGSNPILFDSTAHAYSYAATAGGASVVPSSLDWYVDDVKITSSSSLAGVSISGTAPTTSLAITGSTLGLGTHFIYCSAIYRGYAYSQRMELAVKLPSSRLKWKKSVGGALVSTPALGLDGKVFHANYGGTVYGYADSGSTLVLEDICSCGANLYAPAVIGGDGGVYAAEGADSGADLFSFKSDGSTRWSKPLARMDAAPAIGSDGTVYIGVKTGGVVAVNSWDGSTKWTFSTAAPSSGIALAIALDGTIYADVDGMIYAINRDGSQKWSYGGISPGGSIDLAIGSDGTLYAPGGFGLQAISSSGTLKWSYGTGAYVYGGPAIGADGTIYFGNGSGKVFALTDTGSSFTLKWSYDTGSSFFYSPALDAKGQILIGASDKTVYCLDSAGALAWSYATGGIISSSPVIAADGTIYIGAKDGYIYALRGDAGPATAPWPTLGRNSRHTGNAADE